MKNYLLVNRALAAEKKINLIEMLQGCSKRNGTTFRQSNPDGQPTVNRQSRLMSYRGNLKNLAMIFAVLVMSIANIGMAWGQDTISVAETGEDNGLLKIILAIMTVVGGAGFAIHYTKNVKKNKSSNNQKTEGDFSPATNNTQQGNGNTIDQSTNKGATVINLSSKPILSDRRAADFEQDRQTVESMMSNFSINIVQEFLFGNNQNRLDNRLFDIRDAWYSKYNPVEPIFNNPETERIMKAFYVKFNELIELCANYYDPMNNSDRYSKIRGLICDSFDDRKEDEEHFEQVLQKIKEVEPVYTAMREHVIRRYKINLEELSKKYEGRN